ncbi:MAG: hypothetical protein AB8G96_07095 [Phycisphaerales bacterium]
MVRPEQLASIERRLERMESRQRRMEMLIALMVGVLIIGMLMGGDAIGFGLAILLAVVIGFVRVVRSVTSAGQEF